MFSVSWGLERSLLDSQSQEVAEMPWKCNYCGTANEDPKPRCDLVPEIDIFAPDLPTNLEMMISECKAYETTTGVGTVPLLDYNGMDLVAVEATEDDLKKLNVTH